MSAVRGTSRTLPEAPLASHRQSPLHEVASDSDMPLFRSSLEGRRWEREREIAAYGSRREQVTSGIYELRQRITAKLVGFDPSTKGLDALAERLDEKPSYTGTLSRCLNRAEENRRYQVDWDAPVILDDSRGRGEGGARRAPRSRRRGDQHRGAAQPEARGEAGDGEALSLSSVLEFQTAWAALHLDTAKRDNLFIAQADWKERRRIYFDLLIQARAGMLGDGE